MDWSMKAASAGNVEAQYNIGVLYYNGGKGVPNDYAQAMDWCLKAANNGNTKAMNYIGFMYRIGKGVTTNIRTVIEWHTKAANQGYHYAPYFLGSIYQSYDEVKDLQKAVNWYQKAADKDYYGVEDKIKELNSQGYYAEEDEQEEDQTFHDNNTVNSMNNDLSQSSTTPSNNDEGVIKFIAEEMNKLEKKFESKMNLMQVNNDNLQKEFASLKQKELQHDEENKQLRDELTKLKAAIQALTNNDFNYDPPDNGNNDGDSINYETECNTSEEEQEEENSNSTSNIQKNEIRDDSVEIFADPNYNSSDNEDPRNDIYLD